MLDGIEIRALRGPLHQHQRTFSICHFFLEVVLVNLRPVLGVIVLDKDPGADITVIANELEDVGDGLLAEDLVINLACHCFFETIERANPVNRKTTLHHHHATSMLDRGDELLGVVSISLRPAYILRAP